MKNKSSIKVIPLGGLGEIGKNITAIEFEDEIIIIDCGMTFPDSEMYGVDVVIPDITYLINNKEKVKGFFITHGHKYGVKMGLNNIFYKGKEVEVDAVLFGHTHIKIISKEDGLWIINPGSPSLPKDRVPSIAFIEIKGNEIYPSSFTIK